MPIRAGERKAMKNIVFILMLLLIALMLTGCIIIEKAPVGTPAPTVSALPTAGVSEIPSTPYVELPAITIPGLCTPMPTPSGPVNTASMYSSYAHMVAFDETTGWAQFDYFEILRGSEAVQWLVDKEGKTEAEAQAIVDDYADSEFIEKNTNPQLRTIDLQAVPLKLMYNTDCSMVSGAVPVESSYADFCDIYGSDPALLLDSFFYYITVKSNGSIEVEQVYWP